MYCWESNIWKCFVLSSDRWKYNYKKKFLRNSAVLPLLQDTTVWTNNTGGYSGATLHLQDDGDLQLI